LLYSEDAAEACVFLMNLSEENLGTLLGHKEPPLVNVGTGEDLSSREIAELVCQVVGFHGELEFDPSRPDGTPCKLTDVSRISRLGWKAQTNLRDGISRTLEWARNSLPSVFSSRAGLSPYKA
jgi:GDP-L-fucose synthase